MAMLLEGPCIYLQNCFFLMVFQGANSYHNECLDIYWYILSAYHTRQSYESYVSKSMDRRHNVLKRDWLSR